MFHINPFIDYTICDLKKYQGKDLSFEKMMFTKYPYLYFVHEKLRDFRHWNLIDTLLKLGEEPVVIGKCRECKQATSSSICFYRGNFLTSRGRTSNNQFRACCGSCESKWLDRRDKHHSTQIKFSSITLFDTVQDRNMFINELKYAIGAPSRLSNESAAKYFHDLYESKK